MISMVIALVPSAVVAQTAVVNKSDLSPAIVTDAITNGFLIVEYDDQTGQYSFKTGVSHSSGADVRILFPIGTSFDTFRSLNSGNDYTTGLGFFDSLGIPATSVIDTVLNTVTSTWNIANPDDVWEIKQVIQILGTTEASSIVRVTTTITNNDVVPTALSVRHFWDYQVNGDDGPSYEPRNPNAPSTVIETDFVPPTHQFAIIDDTIGDPLDTTATAQRSVQNREAYVSWPDVFFQIDPFNYVIQNLNVDGDSAVLFYFENLAIQPGGSVSVFSQLQPIVVGGMSIPIDTTALLLVGAQMNAAWMIPVIVVAIGFAIVIARKL